MIKKLLIISGLTIGLMLVRTAPSSAAVVSGSSLTVTPALEQLNLTQGQTSSEFNSSITNNSATPITLTLSVQDFSALNNSGGITFLNNGKNNNHSLASHIGLGQNVITLAAGATQTMPVNITGTDQLAPGGHYAALIYQVVPTGLQFKGNQLHANQEISVLIFLTTQNKGNQSVSVQKPTLSSFTNSFPSSLNLLFTNTGDVQVAPHGLITINHGPQEIARGIINEESGIILPGSSRLYEVPIRLEKTPPLGGYSLTISYQLSALQTPISTSTHLYFVDNAALLIIAIIILVFAWATIFYRASITLWYSRFRNRSKKPTTNKHRRIPINFH